MIQIRHRLPARKQGGPLTAPLGGSIVQKLAELQQEEMLIMGTGVHLIMEEVTETTTGTKGGDEIVVGGIDLRQEVLTRELVHE